MAVARNVHVNFLPQKGEGSINHGFAFGILLYSVTSDSATTFHSKTVFLVGGRDCIKRSKISQNFYTNNLVLVTQRFTASVSNFIVNQIS